MLREIDEGPPPGWDHAREWADRMRALGARAASACWCSRRTPCGACRGLLGVRPERVVWAPNGFEPEGFQRRPVAGDERLRTGARWLVEEPRGWDESGEPGSVAYSDEDLEPFRDGGPVLLYVGALHVGQAHPAPDPRVRSRARALRAAGRRSCCSAAPGRVGGRAPARR